ncbi:hypothetical protein B0H14DRAFT_2568932 [Mycena olivaceomarginata]|nr:hypothetical protein B0H14DRAFT_2568932 [Mycena olivaceomarginata]
MSDNSYDPSSSDYGPGQAISQQHYLMLLNANEMTTGLQNVEGMQELSSPSVTPRATAIEANLRLEEQYAGALNSQMGENTYVENLIYAGEPYCPKPESVDDTDIDLLLLKCGDLEAQRDAAWQELEKVRAERDEAIQQWDKVLLECRTWEKAGRISDESHSTCC